jgi:hypothetical protein
MPPLSITDVDFVLDDIITVTQNSILLAVLKDTGQTYNGNEINNNK